MAGPTNLRTRQHKLGEGGEVGADLGGVMRGVGGEHDQNTLYDVLKEFIKYYIKNEQMKPNPHLNRL